MLYCKLFSKRLFFIAFQAMYLSCSLLNCQSSYQTKTEHDPKENLLEADNIDRTFLKAKDSTRKDFFKNRFCQTNSYENYIDDFQEPAGSYAFSKKRDVNEQLKEELLICDYCFSKQQNVEEQLKRKELEEKLQEQLRELDSLRLLKEELEKRLQEKLHVYNARVRICSCLDTLVTVLCAGIVILGLS